MFVMLLFQLILTISDIEYFLDKDIRIFLPTANHIFMVKNTSTGLINHVSKYANLDDVFSTFKISRDSKKYVIMVDGQFVCVKEDDVSVCNEKYLWDITPKIFGQTISSYDRCLTISPGNMVVLKKCSGTDDQVFDFRYIEEDKECDLTTKKTPTNEVLIKIDHGNKEEESFYKSMFFKMLCASDRRREREPEHKDLIYV